MRSFTSSGIILRLKSLGEADRFVTIYTRDRGKITCIAKGLRSIKSRRNPHVELLNLLRFQHWKSAHHYYLTECTTEESFRELKKDLAALSSATFMIEILDRLTEEDQNDESIFNLLENSLSIIEFYPQNHELIREIFLIKLLGHLGHINNFRTCSYCREKLPATLAYFNKKDYALSCESCFKNKQSFLNLDLEIITLENLKLMHFILKTPLTKLLKINTRPHHLQNIQQWGRVFLYKNLSYPLNSEPALSIY